MSVEAPEQLDLRCPLGPRQLLAKITQEGLLSEDVVRSADRLTLDLACRDCAKEARKLDPRVRRVIHKFNIFGELVETDVQRSAD